MPPEALDEIAARTDGVPLFVEELTKTVLEADIAEEVPRDLAPGRRLATPAIPATLQDLLMARLDGLGRAKEMAQLAACLGRDFTHEMLAAMAPQDEDALHAALARLIDGDLVRRQGAPPMATYSFRHALLQEAAYGSLLKSRRQELHGQIAWMVQERFPDAAERRPEWLAHHYTEAGLIEPAVEQWLKAGQRNKDAHANREAKHI
jgi:predicted ATPase